MNELLTPNKHVDKFARQVEDTKDFMNGPVNGAKALATEWKTRTALYVSWK